MLDFAYDYLTFIIGLFSQSDVLQTLLSYFYALLIVFLATAIFKRIY